MGEHQILSKTCALAFAVPRHTRYIGGVRTQHGLSLSFLVSFGLHAALVSVFCWTSITLLPEGSTLSVSQNPNSHAPIAFTVFSEPALIETPPLVESSPVVETIEETQPSLQSEPPILERQQASKPSEAAPSAAPEATTVPAPDIVAASGKLGVRNGEVVTEMERYRFELYQYLLQNRKYPMMAKRLREQGQVVLEFKIASDGRFFDERIVAPSLSERLNTAALDLIRSLGVFKSPPTVLLNEAGFKQYTVPIEYSLD